MMKNKNYASWAQLDRFEPAGDCPACGEQDFEFNEQDILECPACGYAEKPTEGKAMRTMEGRPVIVFESDLGGGGILGEGEFLFFTHGNLRVTVELENGQLANVMAERIKFTDTQTEEAKQ